MNGDEATQLLTSSRGGSLLLIESWINLVFRFMVNVIKRPILLSALRPPAGRLTQTGEANAWKTT